MRDFILFVVSFVMFSVPAAVAFRRARFELKRDERISAVTFSAALFAYTSLAAGVVLGSWRQAWPVPITQWVSQTFAIILLLAGSALYLSARLQLRSFQQTWALQTDRLITTGIYRLLRHPQNLGWGLLLMGIAVLGKSGVALALTGAYVLSCFVWLPVEEAFLERRFGLMQVRYRSRTPALIRFRSRRSH